VKVLLDSCVWGGARAELAGHGHDVIWAGEWAEDPGDDEILSRAYREGRVLVTLDKDFGELAVVHGQPHSGIIRLVGFAAREQAGACHGVLATHGGELTRGAIATVSNVQLRLRPPPGDE
jgi:predicted nuclease of predicted toxin-antitoxin system